MIVDIGASGFIGTYLVDELVNQGRDVIGTGRNPAAREYYEKRGIPFVTLDMANQEDFEQLPRAGVEGVVLLSSLIPAQAADISGHDYVTVNTLGTLNVLEYCRRNGVPRMVNTASHRDLQKHWDQTTPLEADRIRDYLYTGDHAMYIISKVAATDCVEHYTQEYGLRGATFRLPGVYGYGPHLTAFIDGKLVDTGILTFINRAIAGETIEIWGDPDAGKDLTYVKDVVDAYIAALGSDQTGGIYNISSGRTYTLREMAESIVAVFSSGDRRSEIVIKPEKKNNFRPCLYDISKAKRDFGYEPRYTSFADMMEDLKKEMQAKRFPHLVLRLEKE